jgi:hypothetical protein
MPLYPKKIIPLGSWCRTAYQCRTQAPVFSFDPTPSGPFDWTITPFRSLVRIFQQDFSRDEVLNPIESYINKTGSVTCGYTGITFHHDLSSKIVQSYNAKSSGSDVPDALFDSGKISTVKARFFHTLENLYSTLNEPCNMYVRWIPPSSNAVNFPEVFSGESVLKIRDLLYLHSGHRNHYLLYLKSQIVKGDTNSNSLSR